MSQGEPCTIIQNSIRLIVNITTREQRDQFLKKKIYTINIQENIQD